MKTELLHGTLEVMILKTLTWGRMHGFGIGRWIEAEWGLSEKNRRAKYYSLTPKGRQALRASLSLWTDFAAAVGRVLTSKQSPSRA